MTWCSPLFHRIMGLTPGQWKFAIVGAALLGALWVIFGR